MKCGAGDVTTASWGDARSLCTGIGGYLTSIHNADQQAFAETCGGPAWIGLIFSSSSSRAWEHWFDGTNVTFKVPFITDDDASDCFYVNRNAWDDAPDCNTVYPFVCSRDYISCNALPNPTNGVVSFSRSANSNINYWLSTVATYSCSPGYIPGQAVTRTCLETGQWSGGVSICRPVDCGGPSVPPSGTVRANSTTYLYVAKYSCSQLYFLVGNDERICLSTGLWSGNTPSCQAYITCNALPAPVNGNLTYSINAAIAGKYWNNTAARYSCFTGYNLTSGSNLRTCLGTGQWSGEQRVCNPVDCGSLPNPTNGQVSLSSTTYASVATYSCSFGFFPVGSDQRMCQAGGTWSDNAPSCQANATCDALPSPANGHVAYSSEANIATKYWANTVATFSCVKGHNIAESVASRTCLQTGFWSIMQPTCEPAECGSLSNPTNGQVTFSSTIYQSIGIYSCNFGFYLVGGDQRTCLASGLWSGAAPSCRANATCVSLTSLVNGNVSYNRAANSETEYWADTVATYRCVVGYNLSGSVASRTCLETGAWSNKQLSCQPVDCGTLSNPTNGSVTLSSTTYQSVATYSCSYGFLLVGNDHQTCLATGTWSGVMPSCQGDTTCSALPEVQNGTVTYSVGATLQGAYWVTTVATYSCSVGYHLNNQQVSFRTCLDSGYWSGDEPSCHAVNCGSLLFPTNGQVTLNNTTYLSLASYTCSPGFSLVGDDQRTCLARGSWSGDKPSCTAVDCGDISNPPNGGLSITGTTYQSVANYSCTPGFNLIGNTQRTCSAEGKWSGDNPSCQAVDCGDLPTILNGTSTATTTTFQSVAKFSCNKGFYLDGATQLTCGLDGQWNGDFPLCKVPRNCSYLPSPQNGSVTVLSIVPGSQAKFSCDEGLTLDGVSVITCRSDGSWREPPPTCVKVENKGTGEISEGGNFNFVPVIIGIVSAVVLLSGIIAGIFIHRRRRNLARNRNYVPKNLVRRHRNRSVLPQRREWNPYNQSDFGNAPNNIPMNRMDVPLPTRETKRENKSNFRKKRSHTAPPNPSPVPSQRRHEPLVPKHNKRHGQVDVGTAPSNIPSTYSPVRRAARTTFRNKPANVKYPGSLQSLHSNVSNFRKAGTENWVSNTSRSHMNLLDSHSLAGNPSASYSEAMSTAALQNSRRSKTSTTGETYASIDHQGKVHKKDKGGSQGSSGYERQKSASAAHSYSKIEQNQRFT